MERIMFFALFVAIGALSYGWWHNRSAIQEQEVQRLKAFMNAGPRFTAQDGQELCQVVREIARHSYGLQHSGKPLPDCNYGVKK